MNNIHISLRCRGIE